ncbi:ANTAR domain-containing protein [Spirillospora sp. NPDC048824]
METVSGDRPVMVGDLESADVQRRWPLFAPAASALGAVTVFAFPLLVGVAAVGALEIYWTRRPLGGAALVDGLLFADAALVTLMSGLATGGDWDDSYLDRWPQVHQAAGMVSVQLEIGPAEAYARLRAHAYAGDESLREVARKVVEQELRFSPDMDSS